MKRVLILLSVFGLLLGACGGDNDKKSSSSDDGSTSTTVKDGSGNDGGDSGGEADGALKAKLLTVSDLPAGFKETKSEERAPDNSDSRDGSDFCPELQKLDKEHPGEREAEADFERTGTTGGVYVNEQVSRYKSSNSADDAFSAFENGFAKCKTFTQTDTDGTMTGSFEKTDFAKAGDDTYATVFTAKQTTTDGQNVELKGHFVAMREGKHIILLVALGFGDEVTKPQLESIAKKAVGHF
jgi:hypothetical protein